MQEKNWPNKPIMTCMNFSGIYGKMKHKEKAKWFLGINPQLNQKIPELHSMFEKNCGRYGKQPANLCPSVCSVAKNDRRRLILAMPL
jgi:hypothetical protein